MQILITLDDYCKAYNLQIGVYSPLVYFVGSSELISIANELKLKDVPFNPPQDLIKWAEKTLNLKSTEKY